MRKLFLFLAFALLMTSSAFAQNGVVSIDNVTNEYSATQLWAGKTHVVSIRYDYRACTSANLYIGSNGFEVYSPDGADWVYLQGLPTTSITDPMPAGHGMPSMASIFQKHYDFDGTTWNVTGGVPGGILPAGGSGGTSTRAGFYMATMSVMGTEGATSGVTNSIALTLEFATLSADSGLTMCVDTCYAITAWEWAAGSDQDFPLWDNGDGLGTDAPRCWDVYEVPNEQPEWCDDPVGSATPFNHCGMGTFELCATDPDLTGPVTYEFAPGFENMGEIAGDQWTWTNAQDPPTLDVPQSGTPTIEFRAWDTKDYTAVNFVLSLTILNNPPVFDVCPTDLAVVSVGTPRTQELEFSDPDVCDAPFITLGTVTGDLLGDDITIVGGDVTFTPAGDVPRTVTMEIIVSDGELTDVCLLTWGVIVGSAYQIELMKVEGALQGHFTDLGIKLHSVSAEDGLGGFDLLVAYDASALAFQLALEGAVYDVPYGWEYFNYRYGPYGNCGNACPSGMLRVIGMAETNDGSSLAECVYDAGDGLILAYLRFLVSNDRNLECQYVPVRWFWYDCTDNILASCDGGKAYLSKNVYEYVDLNYPFQDGEMSDGTVGFPTFQGAQDECEYIDEQLGKVAKFDADFQNGGVDIICAEDIDLRGDININGLAYEIADAVMFTNYFISGLGAFGGHVEGSIAASDTNADGIALSVADLVYLIRVVIGDAQPYPKTTPVAAIVTYGNERFNVDVEMGAAHIVMEGDVQPTLLAGNMEMLYASDGQITNILVYSTEANQSFRGDFLEVSGDIVSTEFATFTGARVAAKVMPSTFEVSQNYPNPFNPTTTFKFTVPHGGNWKLDVYNITGQLVEGFSGVSETGYETVVWDASNLSSGIYFYRVSTDAESMTKKAVLLK